MIEIVITPVGLKAPGRFEVRHGASVILKRSRQPLLDAARVFLAKGVPPDTRIGMRHRYATHIALSSTIGAAAKLTVVERNRGNGPVFEPWDTQRYSVQRSPMRENGEGASG